MKGFFNWFKSSTKMKRWILLILIGIAFTCYGIAQLLVLKEITLGELIKIIVMFVIGFTLVVIGLIYIQKRTLELLVENTDDRMDSKDNINMKSLIFNKKVYENGPKVVVIGGGNGLNAVIEGLKEYTNNLTAIVTISDYGEISENENRGLNLLALQDVKNSICSLGAEEDVQKLLDYNFKSGNLKGLNFGDIYLLAAKEMYGETATAVNNSSKIFNITGKVLPVTLDEITICAELENGKVIQTKEKIAEEVLEEFSNIHRIYINPTNCRVAPGVLEAIKEADAIIIGPGSIYTNVIPNLLVKGVTKEIKESKAIKIYISNIMTEPGQTDNYSLSEHIKVITDHVGTEIMDYCICDTEELIPEFIKKYHAKGADVVETDISKVKDVKILQRKISYVKDEFIRHNPKAVAQAIIEIICDDLKYKDEKSSAQYMKLNAKLREEINKDKIKVEKKNRKKKEKHGDKDKKERRRKTSKFNKKYKDRIQSIKNSENQRIKLQKRLEKKKNKKNTKKHK